MPRDSEEGRAELSTASRAIVGVQDEMFGTGWSPVVPSYPAYRVLQPEGAVCVIPRPCSGVMILQVRLFYHVEHPPIPPIHARVGRHEWTWQPVTGWQTLQHRLPDGKGAAGIRFWINCRQTPHFEARVAEVRLLTLSDPRVHLQTDDGSP